MHYDILTSDLIQRAAQLARSLGHSYVGSAHLLLVMAREPGAVGQTLRLLGMDPDLTEAMARLLYGQGTPELPLPQGLTGESRELLRLFLFFRHRMPMTVSISRSLPITGSMPDALRIRSSLNCSRSFVVTASFFPLTGAPCSQCR